MVDEVYVLDVDGWGFGLLYVCKKKFGWGW